MQCTGTLNVEVAKKKTVLFLNLIHLEPYFHTFQSKDHLKPTTAKAHYIYNVLTNKATFCAFKIIPEKRTLTSCLFQKTSCMTS